MSNMSGLFGFIIFIVICLLSSAANKKNKGSTKSSSEKPAEPKPMPKPTQEKPVFTPKAPKVKTAAQPASQERKYYDSTCMSASSEHDHNRRLEQLNDFLKDGIIDREEYRILLQRYEQYR